MLHEWRECPAQDLRSPQHTAALPADVLLNAVPNSRTSRNDVRSRWCAYLTGLTHFVAQHQCLIHDLNSILLPVSFVPGQHDCAEAAVPQPLQDVEICHTYRQPAPRDACVRFEELVQDANAANHQAAAADITLPGMLQTTERPCSGQFELCTHFGALYSCLLSTDFITSACTAADIAYCL